MESLIRVSKARGVSVAQDPTLRLPNRPSQRSIAFEDLGSSNFKSRPSESRSSESRIKPTRRIRQTLVNSDSDDELDCLSSTHSDTVSPDRSKYKTAKGKGKGKEKAKETTVEFHPQYPPNPNPYKGMKINKIKKAQESTDQVTDTGTQTPPDPLFKANDSRSSDNVTPHAPPLTRAAMSSTRSRSQANSNPGPSRPLREKSPNHRLSPSRSSHRCPAEVDATVDKPPRPKPRPRNLTMKLAHQSSLDLDDTGPVVATPKAAVRKPASFPLDAMSPLQSDDIPPASKSKGKSAPGEFPFPSPLQAKQSKGKGKAIERKRTLEEPPRLSPLSSRPAADDFPLPSPLGTPVKQSLRRAASKNGVDYPMPSPLSSDEPGKVVETRAKNLRRKRDASGSKAQPFPMSTQLLESIGSSPMSPPQAGPSRPRKRVRQDTDDEYTTDVVLADLKNYDIYEEDEDLLFISPSTDPKTICPYCDSPLPASPSPLLKRLMAATARKSYSDPRPANPLGLKAPLATFVGVCQRHRFESKILPEAESKGWPKHIDWAELPNRVRDMQESLQAIIDDHVNDVDHSDEEDEKAPLKVVRGEEDKGPRSKCVFWKELIKEVKKKGSRAVAGVQGQFASFEKTQPGYYGELGSVIILQTLYDLFPPNSFDPDLIAPLTSNDFVRRILLLEVAVRLIMQDKQLDGKAGMDEAVKILRDSAKYGVAMFPEDGGEWEGRSRGVDDDEMGVADMLVMERARKRRKELEVEEEEEERWGREQAQKAKQGKSKNRQKTTEKPKRQRKGNEAPVEVPPEPRIPRPRPKAKLKQTTEESDVVDPTTTDTDGNGTSRDSEEDEEAMEVDSVATKPPSSGRYSAVIDSGSGADFVRTPIRSRRKTATRPSSKSSVLDLCSSEDDTRSASDSDHIEVVAASRRGRSKVVHDCHTDTINTPAPPRSQRSSDDVHGDDTPRPRGIQSSSSGSSFFPLMAAQKRSKETGSRRHLLRHASMNVSEPPSETGAEVDFGNDKSFEWLLDSSQSSAGSTTLRE